MKVWIISYTNPKRNSNYTCSTWLDYDKAIAELKKLRDGLDPIEQQRFVIDEFLVSE